VRVTNAPARWVLCFLIVPVLWLALGAGTGLHVVLMVPAAVIAASLSAATAYRSGRGNLATLGYFLGTGAMMGAALVLFVATIFTIYCDRGETSGAC
jgi:hypothetical protein